MAKFLINLGGEGLENEYNYFELFLLIQFLKYLN